VARSLSTGFRRAVPFVLGIAAADLIWLAFSALGLTLLMQSFHGVFLAIKYAGCAYLIYLAWKLWTAPVKSLEQEPAARGEGFRLFLGGVALTLGNPKVMVFFVSILPLVVDLQALTPLAFAEVAVLTMLIINTTLLAYAYAADRARRLVASPRTMRRINRVTGGVMAGAAAAIAARG
jgi:threonine/homoserine/homoserine lactone efflux protein